MRVLRHRGSSASSCRRPANRFSSSWPPTIARRFSCPATSACSLTRRRRRRWRRWPASPLAPEELRTIIGGCGFGVGTTSGGRAYGNGRVAVDVGDAVAHLEQRAGGPWQLVAAVRGPLDVRYADHVAGRPATVRVRTGGGSDRATDLTVRLSQVDVNEPLDADVFRVDIPAGTTPITLDELRQAGPLGR